MRRHSAAAVAVAALAAVAAALLAPSATALVDGPCQIMVGGVDAAGETNVVAPEDGSLPYSVTADQAIVRWVMAVRYGPFTFPVADEAYAADQNARSGAASVSQVARYGSGLYEVTGDATLADGSHCVATLRLQIPGSPLRSVVGLAAAGMVGAGVVGLLALIVKTLMDVNDVRSAVKDFLAEMRKARGEGQAPAAGGNGGDAPAAPAPGPGDDAGQPKP